MNGQPCTGFQIGPLKCRRSEAAPERERTPSQDCAGPDSGQSDPFGSRTGKLHLSLGLNQWPTRPHPSRRSSCIDKMRCQIKISERRVCRVRGQQNSVQRRLPKRCVDEGHLFSDSKQSARHENQSDGRLDEGRRAGRLRLRGCRHPALQTRPPDRTEIRYPALPLPVPRRAPGAIPEGRPP